MTKHIFLFTPGEWIGQGKLTFSSSPAHLRFYAKWVIGKVTKGEIHADQWIEQQGEANLLGNAFIISEVADKSFKILLSTEMLGTVTGKGIIDEKTIAWEFPQNMNKEREDAFEGFEVYELQDNGDYLFHAEYFSGEQFRTIVEGRIWKKG